MHIEPRLLVFTKGVRGRIAAAVGVGLLSVSFGVARLGLLGWLIGQVFAGKEPSALVPPILLIALVMVARGAGARDGGAGAEGVAPHALRQDREPGTGHGRPPALGRFDALDDRRRRAARDLLRPVPAAV